MSRSTASPSSALAPDSPYAWYCLLVLTACYTLAYVDRQIISLIVDPIRAQFGLTDTAISLLIGLAFTVPYAVTGLAFGRWVDRGTRRNIVLIGGTLWGLGAASMGLAGTYGLMVVSRALVGSSESAMYPSGVSMITDYFSRRRLPRALSIFLLAGSCGVGLSLVFGGFLLSVFGKIGAVSLPVVGSLQPWQMTVLTVGATGMLPVIAVLSVREPIRREQDADIRLSTGNVSSDSRFSLWDGMMYLHTRRRFYLFWYIGVAFELTTLYALTAWAPSFLIRHFALPASTVGLRFGVMMLTFGSVGTLLGPWCARWLEKRGHIDGHMRAAAIAMAFMAPTAAAVPFAPTFAAGMIILSVLAFLASVSMVLATTALQLVCPNRLRGLANALYLVIASVAAQAIAPTVIALLTDYVFRDSNLVGWSLGIVGSISAVAGATAFGRGLKGFREFWHDSTDQRGPSSVPS
jgi:MFS transporter, Spinster family, sphingosine-1-phosphate transporter